jgi:NADPH:quinone reductase-like Zn-dependent oxidoreductase
VQLAVSRGLRVIGTASAAKHGLIAQLGAVPVAYGEGVLDRIGAEAPAGVDAVFDLVGGCSLRTVAELVEDRGRVLSVADKGLVKELGGRETMRDRSSAVLTELARLVVEGVLDPYVSEVRPLHDAAAALAVVEEGHALGKIVLTLEPT